MPADRYRFVVDLAYSNGRRDERNEVVDSRAGNGSLTERRPLFRAFTRRLTFDSRKSVLAVMPCAATSSVNGWALD